MAPARARMVFPPAGGATATGAGATRLHALAPGARRLQRIAGAAMQQAERVATVPAPAEPVGPDPTPRRGLWSPPFALLCGVSFFCYVHWCILGPIMPLWIQ